MYSSIDLFRLCKGPNNVDSHFLVILGYDSEKLILWDPECTDKFVTRRYEDILPGIRNAWVYSGNVSA